MNRGIPLTRQMGSLQLRRVVSLWDIVRSASQPKEKNIIEIESIQYFSLPETSLFIDSIRGLEISWKAILIIVERTIPKGILPSIHLDYRLWLELKIFLENSNRPDLLEVVETTCHARQQSVARYVAHDPQFRTFTIVVSSRESLVELQPEQDVLFFEDLIPDPKDPHAEEEPVELSSSPQNAVEQTMHRILNSRWRWLVFLVAAEALILLTLLLWDSFIREEDASASAVEILGLDEDGSDEDEDDGLEFWPNPPEPPKDDGGGSAATAKTEVGEPDYRELHRRVSPLLYSLGHEDFQALVSRGEIAQFSVELTAIEAAALAVLLSGNIDALEDGSEFPIVDALSVEVTHDLFVPEASVSVAEEPEDKQVSESDEPSDSSVDDSYDPDSLDGLDLGFDNPDLDVPNLDEPGSGADAPGSDEPDSNEPVSGSDDPGLGSGGSGSDDPGSGSDDPGSGGLGSDAPGSGGSGSDDPGSGLGGSGSDGPTIDASGGTKTIDIPADASGRWTIHNFGGVGRGAQPTDDVLVEVDTLFFLDATLQVQDLILTQVGQDLRIFFTSNDVLEVWLTDFELENFDNLTRATPANVDFANLRLVTEDGVQDSFDVFNREVQYSSLYNPNSVSFCGFLDNFVQGMSDVEQRNASQSDDVLVGGAGNNVLEGGAGADRFQLDPQGYAFVSDFMPGEDVIILASSMIVDELSTAFVEQNIVESNFQPMTQVLYRGQAIAGLAGQLSLEQLTIQVEGRDG